MSTRAATTRANQAFEAHAAVLRAQVATPSLLDNPFWTIIRQDAYERAVIEFEKV